MLGTLEVTASSSHEPLGFRSATSMAQLRNPTCAWPRGTAQMPAPLQTVTYPQFYLLFSWYLHHFTTCCIMLQPSGRAHLATLRHRLWKSRKAASSSPSAPCLLARPPKAEENTQKNTLKCLMHPLTMKEKSAKLPKKIELFC